MSGYGSGPAGSGSGPGPGTSGTGRRVVMAGPVRSMRAFVLRSLVAIVLLLALAYGAATWSAHSASEVHPTIAERWPDGPHVIAHQGGDHLWPGNTRLAMDGAAELGADVLEMDVHLTSDEELVTIHDATVDRTTDATGAVAEATAEDLAALDAGHAWTPDDGATFPYRGSTGGVPRLVEVLRDHLDAPLVVELKDAGERGERAAGVLCDLLHDQDRAGHAVVASFHPSTMRTFRGACPEVATSATPDEVRTFVLLSRARVAGPLRPTYAVLQVPVRQGGIEVITPSLIRAANAKGVQVQAWTINDTEDMDRLSDLGVHGLITDRPDRALRATGRTVDEALLPGFVAR
ncbi:MAG: glycerophosphodiester phosphodiesterase [Trueperaceae bacterium]